MRHLRVSAILCLATLSHAALLGRRGGGGGGRAVLLAAEEPPAQDEPTTQLASAIRDGIQQQTLDALKSRGESITIMVVGDAGVGKTSLLANLLHQSLEQDEGVQGPTTKVTEKTLKFDLDGVPFSARLIDSPGYSDSLDYNRGFKLVTDHIDKTLRRTLKNERRARRADRAERDAHRAVDVVLYFFSPHRCKVADMAFLKRLQGRVSIVPVLAKADTMTPEELSDFRREVAAALDSSHVATAHQPVAVICSAAGAEPRGRAYPWGVALSEDGEHSELPQLRRFLLIDGLLALKRASDAHYEAYRRKALRRYGWGALLKAVLGPLQLGLVSMAAPTPRRWARGKLAVVTAAWRDLQSRRVASLGGAAPSRKRALIQGSSRKPRK
tara:strand:+ start:18 stop:1169 length:1152 start_codon:yes stop_codon:yes gene_type:complete